MTNQDVDKALLPLPLAWWLSTVCKALLIQRVVRAQREVQSSPAIVVRTVSL